MSELIPDLLPDNLPGADEEPTPGAILRAQASRLGAKTKNVVVAEVVALRSIATEEETEAGMALVSRDEREYGFNLIVPALENYTYQAFRVSYSVTEMYPVKIGGAVISREMVAKDREHFMKVLREIFSSPQFLRLINSLMREALSMTA